MAGDYSTAVRNSTITGSSGSLAGGIAGGLTYLLSSGGEDEYKKALQVIQAVQDPDYDWSKIQPAELALVAKYDPQTYNAVVPQEVRMAHDSPELRAAQQQGLAQWQQIGREGLPESERIAAQGAQGSVRQGYRQALETSLGQLQARGRAGGGAELALRAAAGQQSANLARDQGNDLAVMRDQNRLMGLQQGTAAAGQMRGQDIEFSRGQAQDYNAFTQYISQLQTQAARDAAASRQAASNANVQGAQQVANFNAVNRQQTQESNVNRINDLKNKLALFRLQKALGTSSAYGGLGRAEDAQQAGLVNTVSGLAGGGGTLGTALALY